jgi:phosphoenolpyruvate---glycerone phosphotransferase subunit DhaL
VPAVDTLEEQLTAGRPPAAAIQAASVTARDSAEATKGMLAQRGRAAYAGERSRDSVDAGAIAVAEMFEAVSRAWSPTSV